MALLPFLQRSPLHSRSELPGRSPSETIRLQAHFSQSELTLTIQTEAGETDCLWSEKLSSELLERLSHHQQQQPHAAQALLTRLGAINLAPIAQKLRQSQARYWSRSRLHRALSTYVCFLLDAALQPAEPLVAVNGDMDTVWHCHILQTQKYTQDCLAIFGHYLHHEAIAPGACNIGISSEGNIGVNINSKGACKIGISANSTDGACKIGRSVTPLTSIQAA